MSLHSSWSLSAWLAWQEKLHPRGIDLGLERVRRVAQRMGLVGAGTARPPGTSRPVTLTVSGTNGKGSSATLASLIYRCAGYRVGLYTSPHLLRYNERVSIDGQPASDDALCAAFRAIESVRQDESLTYFEFGTLAALWLFREARVDAQVLEVGLGGRLDAVNLVDADAALITNIGLDHTDWLGPDRESIGAEKAGILRAGRPAIVAEREPPASIVAKAAELRARPAILGRDFDYRAGEGSWEWRGPGATIPGLPLPGLSGEAQLRNAAGVLAAIDALRPHLPVDEAAIRAALPRLALPGRFERRGNLILDVAHNVEAAAVLVENLRAESIAGRIHLVLGMLRDKPVEAFCRTLKPVIAKSHVATLPPPRGLTAQELMERASDLQALPHASVGDALAAARAEAGAGDRILVTGSFLTVAAASGA